ncbi:cytosolic leucyl tRNA synthetase [Coemansia sp. RSA 1813]|nr:cytosolic leucyl tRNA synthetase [Coemansia sp. RSA 1646]KAJ2572774.1 cytosolic leucyl tRNA synthetase [Coemansia sp. RSA 1813]
MTQTTSDPSAADSAKKKEWEGRNVFETDMPDDTSVSAEELHKKYPKWMGTFPFPYMNGTLHLGHAFSVSKVEFAAGWERLKGKRTLFPFGFHVTGMPIKAAADKIAREVEMFGPDFSVPEEVDDLNDKVAELSVADTPDAAAQNFRGKKSKAAAKFGKHKYQFQVMQAQGMANADIVKFVDAKHWLEYYPPIAIADLKALGCKIDWRRAFLTTDYNPYYDSFARWQFERLHEMGKIKFGNRYTIWSPKDGQPCMDHDRQTGEGVNPQVYTGVKMEVLEWSEQGSQVVSSVPELAGKKVFLVAATLRPETMYGQTNCFVGTKLEYGFYQSADPNEVYVVSDRAARNMAFQALSPADGRVVALGRISGQDIVGTKVNAPLSFYTEGVYVLPMENVLSTKGTGVVTSVPSDSPDDYAALRDLKKKTDYYGIKHEWVDGFEPVPVISTATYGSMIAPAVCDQKKITSQKDRVQLVEAKDIAYKEGFYNGTMSVGEFKGESVQLAKNKVSQLLIANGNGFEFAEPEKPVTSRSADDCVVALCDQWYFDYGESVWKEAAEKCLASMETYGEETRHQFKIVLNWLKQWACVRTYGLGSKVPWDPNYLIESLSDSTIYMSYYTVAHLLHESLDGSKPGPLGLTPADMDNTAWDYVLLGKPLPADHNKTKEMEMLRRSFLYWYPVDVRSSGKDLIQNHLTFFIYVHSALFPESKWPRAVRVNGHLLLNGEKMSKSTGNMLTLGDSCKLYGADATRIALADAGDGFDDANFEMQTADAAVRNLYTLMDWVVSAKQALIKLEQNPSETVQVDDIILCAENTLLTMIDKIFDAEMNDLVLKTAEDYDKTMYRNALKSGFYDFVNLRNWYVEFTSARGMNPALVRKWIDRQVLLISPIAPHWAEQVWKTVMGNNGSIMDLRLPADMPSSTDHTLLMAGDYVRKLAKSVRDADIALQKRNKKKGGKNAPAAVFDPNASKLLDIFVASEFPSWQETVISVLKENYDASSSSFDDKAILGALGKTGVLKNKKTMPFANEIKKRVELIGSAAFVRALQFNETDLANEAVPYLKNSLGYTQVNVIVQAGAADTLTDAQAKAAESAVPGEPGLLIANN